MYEFFDKYKDKVNKKHLYIIFIVGVIIVLLSGVFKTSKPKTIEKHDEVSTDYLEKKLCGILSEISGVGDVSVMITYETSKEKISLSNDKISTEKDRESVDKEIVMKSNGSQKEPFISKEIEPVVRGVLVVAEGAEAQDTRVSLVRAVSSVLDVPVNRVEVLPKNKEEKRWWFLTESRL